MNLSLVAAKQGAERKKTAEEKQLQKRAVYSGLMSNFGNYNNLCMAIEQFYSIEHLTTEQLRELWSSYRDRGWVDFEYHKLMYGVKPPELVDDVILSNIHAENLHNYFVYMQGIEDEQDGVMIGFGLTNYPDFGAYLHLDESLLDGIVKKYGLKVKATNTDRPLSEWGKDITLN